MDESNVNKAMKSYKRKRNSLIALICFLSVVLVLLVGFTVWWQSFLGQRGTLDVSVPTLTPDQESVLLEQGDTVPPDFTGPSYTPEEAPVPEQPVPTVPSEDVVNILVVGRDSREGWQILNTDAMILCSFNKTKKTLVLTSFLRDTWVAIPGKYNERLNVPYSLGGFPLLNDTLEYNFGVRGDYNVEVDFEGFSGIIDAVGGVDINLTAAEAAHLNAMRETNPPQFQWHLKEGVNTLTGEQALAYARIRALDSDFGRTNRQRTVLRALVDKTRSLNFTQLYALANELLPMVKTDMTDRDITSLLLSVVTVLPELKIVDQRVPYSDQFEAASINGKAVLVIKGDHLQSTLDRLKETIGK